MKTLSRTIWLMLVVAITGSMAFVNGQSGGPNFTEFKFFSTKGAFDWDKVVYATSYEKRTLHELQVLIEFENPGEKPFNLEVKTYLDGKLIKTEPFKDLTKTGGVNSGVGGSPETAGTVAPGVYTAELWYNGKVVKTAEATVTGAESASASGGKDIWHLIVESREDIGETAAEFKADLKKAFEARGDTVVDAASKESVDLHFYLGKDDADDDNDGKSDDKDVGDGNGDGIVNEQDMAEVIDLDKEIPDVMDDYPDKNKSAGIYIYVETETGLAMVFVSDADSLNEGGASASRTFTGNAIFMNASFAPRRVAVAGPAVAAQVVNKIDASGGTRLYVGNLSYEVTEDEIRVMFVQAGTVIAIEIPVDRITTRPKGFALVRMANPQEANKAITMCNGKTLGDKQIRVNVSQPKDSDASRASYIRR